MRPTTKQFLLVFILLASISLYAQDSCKVLVPALKGSYTGGCKKGLAQGQGKAEGIDSYEGSFRKGFPNGTGTYRWSTGEIYIGEWKMGKRDGEGSYTFKVENRDTTVIGLWKNDIYAGPIVKRPSVARVNNIDQYKFTKTLGIQSRVMIDFQQNGTSNAEIENLMLSSTSGTNAKSGRLVGFDNVIFPTTVTVRYDTYNKLKTMKYTAYIEFTIFEPGDWEVKLTN